MAGSYEDDNGDATFDQDIDEERPSKRATIISITSDGDIIDDSDPVCFPLALCESEKVKYRLLVCLYGCLPKRPDKIGG